MRAVEVATSHGGVPPFCDDGFVGAHRKVKLYLGSTKTLMLENRCKSIHKWERLLLCDSCSH